MNIHICSVVYWDQIFVSLADAAWRLPWPLGKEQSPDSEWGLWEATHSVSLQCHPLTFPWKSRGSEGGGAPPLSSVYLPAAAFGFHSKAAGWCCHRNIKGDLGTLQLGLCTREHILPLCISVSTNSMPSYQTAQLTKSSVVTVLAHSGPAFK